MNVYDILKSFSGDNEFRPWLNEPFRVGNKAYATDDTMLISVNKEHLDAFESLREENESGLKNVLQSKRKHLPSIMTSELKNVIEEAPQQDCFDVSGSEVDCIECYGFGEVTWEYGGHEMEHDCPVCDGNGTIGRVNKTPNGKKEISDNVYFEIGEGRYKGSIINRLLEVAVITKSNEIEILFHGTENQPCLVKIGIFKILFMNVMKDKDQKVIKKYS